MRRWGQSAFRGCLRVFTSRNRLDRGYLSPHSGQPVRAHIRGKATQIVAFSERIKGAIILGNDELREAMCDASAARVYVGIANLPAPGVHILHQVGVNRLQMCQWAAFPVAGEVDPGSARVVMPWS